MSNEDKKNNFIPISIWDYNIGDSHYIFEVTHDAGDTEESAIEIANYELINFGFFVDTDSSSNKKLIYGSRTKNGMFMHIPQSDVKVKILKLEAQERLAPPIPMDSKENKKKAVDALLNMDESYMITDDDYMDVSDSVEDIAKCLGVNITKNTPLLFSSIAYRIEN